MLSGRIFRHSRLPQLRPCHRPHGVKTRPQWGRALAGEQRIRPSRTACPGLPAARRSALLLLLPHPRVLCGVGPICEGGTRMKTPARLATAASQPSGQRSRIEPLGIGSRSSVRQLGPRRPNSSGIRPQPCRCSSPVLSISIVSTSWSADSMPSIG